MTDEVLRGVREPFADRDSREALQEDRPEEIAEPLAAFFAR